MNSWLFPTSVEKRLFMYALIADAIFTLGLLTWIFSEKLDVSSYFYDQSGNITLSRLSEFLIDKGALALLSMLLIYVFVAWRFSSRMELDIAKSLFPAARLPQEWAGMHGHSSILWLILTFYALFLLIAYSIENLPIFCSAFAGLYIVALRSQKLRIDNLEKYFHDRNFQPRDTDEHKDFILRRRKVAEEYLFSGRHLVKDGIVAIVAIIAAIYATYTYISTNSTWNWISFAIIVGTIIVNEAIILRWRITRQRVLWQIEEDQERADRERVSAASA